MHTKEKELVRGQRERERERLAPVLQFTLLSRARETNQRKNDHHRRTRCKARGFSYSTTVASGKRLVLIKAFFFQEATKRSNRYSASTPNIKNQTEPTELSVKGQAQLADRGLKKSSTPQDFKCLIGDIFLQICGNDD